MTRLVAVSLLVCGLLCATAAPSSADTITFDNSSLHIGGTFAMGTTTVQLSGGVIDAVARTLTTIGFNVTGACGVGAIYGCLSLTTGTFVGPDGSTPGTNDYIYMGLGSSLSIVGGINDGTNQLLPNGTPLFTAAFDPNANIRLTFDDICFLPPVNGLPQPCTGGLDGTLTIGTINPALAALLGVSSSTLGGNGGSLFVGVTGSIGANGNISIPLLGPPTGTGVAANTNDLEVIAPAVTVTPLGTVPEPGSLVLLGSGLLFAAKFARRRWAA